MDHIEECGIVDEGPMAAMAPPAPEMDKGNPVTVSVSMNASGKEHVADLLDMMKNAGLGDAGPAADKMMSPRMDMERLAGIMDDPKIPGKDDVPGDADIDDSSCMDDIDADVDEGAVKTAMIDDAETMDKEDFCGKYMAQGMDKAECEEQWNSVNEAETEDMSGEGTYNVKVKGKNMASQNELARLAGMSGSSDTDVDEAGDYANEPDPQYGDMSDAIPDGNDLNRKKKSYAATQDGDNPMAVENIKAALMAALQEKKLSEGELPAALKAYQAKKGKGKAPAKGKSKSGKMPMDAGKDGKKGTKDDKPAFLTKEGVATKDCPKCGAPGKKKLMACSTCGCS